MKSLLLTAFDPFAHYTMNPSWEVVQALPETINNYHIHKLRLPNIFGLAPRLLLEEAQRVQPDVILMTGMNSGTMNGGGNIISVNSATWKRSSKPSMAPSTRKEASTPSGS